MSTRDEKIKLDVTGADKSARDLNNVGDAAVKAGDSVYVMGEQADKAAKGVDELGDEAQQTGQQLSRLERDVLKARAAVKALNDEYERDGGDKVLENLHKQQVELGKLETVQKRVKKLHFDLAGGKTGSKATSLVGEVADDLKRAASLAGQASEAVTGMAGQLKGLAGVGGPIGSALSIGIPAAAIAGATVPALAAGGGAVLAAGALGAVGGGIAGAAMGARGGEITGAFGHSLDDLKSRFIDATSSWVNPTLDSIGELDKAFRAIPVEGIFKDAEGYIEPLTHGLTGLLTNTTSGLDDLVRSAGPVVDMLGTELPDLGSDIGDSLRIIGTGAPGAAAALGDVLDIVGGLTKAFAGAAAGAGMLYEEALNTPVLKQGHDLFMSLFDFKDLPMSTAKALGGVADSASASATSFGSLASSLGDAALATSGLNDAVTKTRSNLLGLGDANIALAQGWLNLKKGLEDGKRTLDMSTQAGIDNVTSIKDQVANAEALREQQIKTGDGTVGALNGANAAYDASIEKIRAAAYAAHFNKAEVDAMIKSYSEVPAAKETKISAPGMASALAQGVALGTALNNIDGTYTARINISGVANALGQAARLAASLPSHAAGGTMPFSGPKLVGEKGAEIIWGSQGQYVSTAEQTAALMRGGGGGAATAPPIVRVIVEYPDGRVIRDQLVTTASNEGKSVGQLIGV